MSHTHHDHDRHARPRHETHSSRQRDAEYSPRHAPPREKPAMRGTVKGYEYGRGYGHDYDYDYPHRSVASARDGPRTAWPPAPAVQDESGSDEGEPPGNTRGTVDQEHLLDEMQTADNAGLTAVHPAADDMHTADPRRRKSFADRGNMAHLRTDVESDPLLFTKRVSTPYSYTPQKDSTAPSAAGFVLSPEPLTPPKSLPLRTRRDSFTRPAPAPAPAPQPPSTAVFDDSASDAEDTAHLRTNERKPARYSFVKSDAQKEHSRASLREGQRPPTARHPPPAHTPRDYSSASSKESPYHSPRSSSSSVNSEKKKSRPAPLDTAYATSRPTSPMHRAPSPKLPPRLRDSPPGSRPSSRGNATRPASPLAWSTTISPPSPRQLPVTEADWHSTYPPANKNDRPRPPSRFGRHETIQIPPNPRVDVQSPSPVRPSNPLPYPVEHHHATVWMPGEEHYQFDHSTVSSPRQVFRDAPMVASPSVLNSPRQADGFRERAPKPRTPRPEEAPRTRRSRSNSVDSKHSSDGRTKSSRTMALIDRPLPNCARPTATDRYDDWYSLAGYRDFDVCPSCYDGVFAGTPFAREFSQTRKYERPTERFCDFSSAWVRLAWLLTIKQRRQSMDLIYGLADIADSERLCPGDREVSTERMSWYGIADQRDGLHVANFAVCSTDVKNLDALFPSIRGYFTRLPTSPSSYGIEKHTCSLRTTSRRFPKYLDLLVALDADAHSTAQRPNMSAFIQLARENAFKAECARSKPLVRKPWHFIPHLPAFTVCEECYAECVWPLSLPGASTSTLPRLVNKSIQLVPGEDPELGSSCVLYGARMRRVWDVSVRDDDFAHLQRKVLERRRREVVLAKERRGVLQWLAGQDKGSRAYERAREELRALDAEWRDCE